MNNVFSEELLSAYLDDELSADERGRVENALEENSNLRRTLDDLQMVSAQLQQLPRFQVGRDLSAEVLRKIEQSELANNELGRIEHRPSVSKPLAPPASKNSRRSLYWALSALAATVAFVAFASLPPWRGSDSPAIVDKGSVDKGSVDKGSIDKGRPVAQSPGAESSNDAGPVEKPSAADVATTDAPRGAVDVAPNQPKAHQPKAMTLRTATPKELVAVPKSLAGAADAALPPRADLKLDFSGKNHAVRLACSAKVLRGGAFDAAVKRQGISYHLTGESRPSPAFAQDHRIAKGETDAVLVVATPPQIEDLLADLASRPDAFYPTAAYSIEYNSFLMWLAYLADSSSSRSNAGGAEELSHRGGSDRSFSIPAFFQNRTKNGFAWRAPQPTQDEIEGFFPAPTPAKTNKPAAAAEKKARSVEKKVDMTERLTVLFFLQATTSEQP